MHALPNFSADKAIAVLEKYPMISEYVSAVGASKSTMEVTDFTFLTSSTLVIYCMSTLPLHIESTDSTIYMAMTTSWRLICESSYYTSFSEESKH